MKTDVCLSELIVNHDPIQEAKDLIQDERFRPNKWPQDSDVLTCARLINKRDRDRMLAVLLDLGIEPRLPQDIRLDERWKDGEDPMYVAIVERDQQTFNRYHKGRLLSFFARKEADR